MEGFKRGFYTTSKKLERKPESNLGQSSFSQPQPFSQYQQPREKQKQVQKIAHATTLTSQEKPRKQMKSALHQEVSELNPSSQMSMEQLIKAVLSLQEDVRNQERIMTSQRGIQTSKRKLNQDSCPRKEIQMLSETFLKIKVTNIKASNRSRQKLEIEQRKQKKVSKNYNYKWTQESTKVTQCRLNKKLSESLKKKQKQIKIRKNAFVEETYDIYDGNVRNSSRKN